MTDITCNYCKEEGHKVKYCEKGLKSNVGRAQVRTSNLSVPDLKTQLTTIQMQRYKSHTTSQHHPFFNLHPRTMIQKTNFATTPIQRTSVRPTEHQIGPPLKTFLKLSTAIDGLSFCCLASADGQIYH